MGCGGYGCEGRQEVAAGDGHAAGVNEQLLVAVVDLRVVPPHRLQRRLCAQRLGMQTWKFSIKGSASCLSQVWMMIKAHTYNAALQVLLT